MKIDLEKIVSGGQTGADRAALDFAMQAGIPHGGWIPRGRLTEEGPLDRKYHFKETESSEYSDRTEKNVLDSDGTLIFFYGRLTGGSLLTSKLAERHRKPLLLIDLEDKNASAAGIKEWLKDCRIRVLNVAGPRASTAPGIYSDAFRFLKGLL